MTRDAPNSMEYRVVYPLKYLLRNHNLFYAISEQLGDCINPEELYDFFFQFYSESLDPSNVEGDIEDHIPDQVMFEASMEEGEEIQVRIFLNNGDGCILTGKTTQGTGISDEGGLQEASFIYHTIVDSLEKLCPEYQGDVYLVSTPSPANDYLQHPDGSGDLTGVMGLHSDPKKKFKFRLTCNKGEKARVNLDPTD